LQREVLVEPTLGMCSRHKWASIKDIAELVARLWADSIGAQVDREGDADFNATYDGILKPRTSMNGCMVDLVLNAHWPKDLSGEALAWAQDSPISGGTNLNGLAKGRCHNTENRDNREQLHLQKGMKKRRERKQQVCCSAK